MVFSPRESIKIPEVEQILSAGAVCLSLLNVALASGWGANWLTDWIATERVFLKQGLGLTDEEFVAGYIHIGTESIVPPEERYSLFLYEYIQLQILHQLNPNLALKKRAR